MFDEAFAVPLLEHRPPLRVALAGSFVSFSDRLLSLLQAEFPAFEFERVDGAALDGPARANRLHLLICEEGLIAQALLLPRSAQAAVAVAFDDAPSIAAHLAGLGLDGLPAGLSLLPMNLRLDAWLSVMGLLLQGESYVPMSVLRELTGWSRGSGSLRNATGGLEGSRPPAGPGPAPQRLTGQERRILPLIAQGKQNKVIADELALSEHTVKLHVHHIIGKLGLRNRTEVAGYYLARLSEREAL